MNRVVDVHNILLSNSPVHKVQNNRIIVHDQRNHVQRTSHPNKVQILNLSGITTTHKKMIKGVLCKDSLEATTSRHLQGKTSFYTNDTVSGKMKTPSTINLNFQNFSNSLTTSNRKPFLQKDVNEYSDKH